MNRAAAPRPVMWVTGLAAVLIATLGMAAARAHSASEPPRRDTAEAAAPPSAASLTRHAYAAALDVAAGVAWQRSAAAAIAAAPLIDAPYLESGAFALDAAAASTADARAYSLRLHAGELLQIELESDAPGARLFLELYSAAGPYDRPVAVSEWTAGHASLRYTAQQDAAFVAVLQPPYGAQVRYTLRVSRSAALTFPVDGASSDDVIGHFFDARDGGARHHRGVDIRAPQGTAVLAGAHGTIDRVEDTPLGGLVVWLQETGSSRRHYYAHLDTQLVRPGQRVMAGEPIGSVGRTGNAADTPPHLHFGLYIGNDVLNPYRFLRDARLSEPGEPPAWLAVAGAASLPRDAVVRLGGAAFRTSPAHDGPVMTLQRSDTVRIVARSGRLARVRLPDGREGFVADWLLQPL